ncbi:MAG: hypothetical protein N3F64_03240 [Nitrososphaeria archaeon]|nr:hypothetical protein [Nitrososphaeria archaeon]
MSYLNRFLNITGKAMIGILSGIIWTILYVYIIPSIISGTGFYMEEVSAYYIWIMMFFIITGVAISLIENLVYKFTLNTLTKILGFWILTKILNNGILSTTLFYQDINMMVTIDFTIILYLIGIWTISTIFIDFCNIVSKTKT